jgi:tRNA G46 methylase TrmB
MMPDSKPYHGCDKIIVELGSGDGRLLVTLARLFHKDDNALLIGIEIDKAQHRNACAHASMENVQFINDAFENVLAGFSDDTVDTILSIFPHPDYIDKTHQDRWAPIYRAMLSKMKPGAHFVLVTEMIDELLEPVSDADYGIWKGWIVDAFREIGFEISKAIDGVPPYFSSQYLEKFKGDPQRIKIITLIMAKRRYINGNGNGNISKTAQDSSFTLGPKQGTPTPFSNNSTKAP